MQDTAGVVAENGQVGIIDGLAAAFHHAAGKIALDYVMGTQRPGHMVTT